MMAIVALLGACSHSYYRDGQIEVSRWALGTDLDVQEAAWGRKADGSMQFRLEGVSSEQSKAIEAAARGAAEGAAKAISP